MLIQSNQPQNSLNILARVANTQNPAEVSGATSGRMGPNDGKSVALSEEAKQLSESKSIYTLSTVGGDKDYDLDTYFKPKTPGIEDVLNPDNLLLPSSQNVKALQDHLSKVFPEFLFRHNIPEAPESIRYDSQGGVVLPAGYPYAEQLTQALEQEPSIERELRTANALASHVAALQQLEPFHLEMEKAVTQAEIDAAIDRFSHLLGDNRSYPEVQLSFTKEGRMTVTSDGTALV